MREENRFSYFQGWLMLICLMLLALYIAHDQGYLALMLASDRSFISSVIVLGFLMATCHAAWNLFAICLKIEAVQAAISPMSVASPQTQNGKGGKHHHYVENFIDQLSNHRSSNSAEVAAQEAGLVLDVAANDLRNPSETGWYLVDILIRLGLVGTIIGFVLVLSALSDGPPPSGDNIQSLLIAMSGGMGVALYTTLAGLICGTLLGAQHMILSRATEHLIALLINLKSRVMNENLS